LPLRSIVDAARNTLLAPGSPGRVSNHERDDGVIYHCTVSRIRILRRVHNKS
jgi:hypothetical protein